MSRSLLLLNRSVRSAPPIPSLAPLHPLRHLTTSLPQRADKRPGLDPLPSSPDSVQHVPPADVVAHAQTAPPTEYATPQEITAETVSGAPSMFTSTVYLPFPLSSLPTPGPSSTPLPFPSPPPPSLFPPAPRVPGAYSLISPRRAPPPPSPHLQTDKNDHAIRQRKDQTMAHRLGRVAGRWTMGE